MKTKELLAARPVIVNEDDSLIMARRSLNPGKKDAGKWEFTGGTEEDTDEDLGGLPYTAKREAGEEIGVEVVILDGVPFYIHNRHFTDETGRRVKHDTAFFLARLAAGAIAEFVIQRSEVEQADSFTVDEAKRLHLTEASRAALGVYEQGRRNGRFDHLLAKAALLG